MFEVPTKICKKNHYDIIIIVENKLRTVFKDKAIKQEYSWKSNNFNIIYYFRQAPLV